MTGWITRWIAEHGRQDALRFARNGQPLTDRQYHCRLARLKKSGKLDGWLSDHGYR